MNPPAPRYTTPTKGLLRGLFGRLLVLGLALGLPWLTSCDGKTAEGVGERPTTETVSSGARSLSLGPSSSPSSGPPDPALTGVPEPGLAQLEELAQQQIEEHQLFARRALATQSGNPRAEAEILGDLGTVYLAYGLTPSADAAFRRAAKVAPEDPRWPYYLGHSLRDQNRPQESLARLQEAVRLAPQEVPFLVRLGEVLLDQGQSAQAEEAFQRAITVDPSCAPAQANLGQIAAADGRLEEAVRHYEQALVSQPQASALRYPLALAYRDLGRRSEAERELERRGSQDTRLQDPLMRRVYGLSDGLRQALAAAQQAVDGDDLDAAAAALETAVGEDPLFSESRLLLSQILLARNQAGDRRAALDQLKTALERAPEASRPRLALAYQLQSSGQPADLSEAVAQYQELLRREPTQVGARINLANALQALDRHREAAEEYARVTTEQPANRRAWLGEATALLAGGRCAEARLEMERGLAALPRDAVLSHALARLMATCPEAPARDGARALDLAVALFQARPTAGHAEAVALAGAELGRFEEAAEWQRRALELAGESLLAPVLQRNLALFEQGLPGRTPWSAEALGVFDLKAPEAPSSDS